MSYGVYDRPLRQTQSPAIVGDFEVERIVNDAVAVQMDCELYFGIGACEDFDDEDALADGGYEDHVQRWP